MAGTVTGKDANLWICAHSGTASLANVVSRMTNSTPNRTHTGWGIGDFSLTLDRGTVEQDLVGQVGNYFDQGSLSADGSLTSVQFGASGIADFLLNLVDTHSTGFWQYLAISGTVSDSSTGGPYLSWFIMSAQVTGYDISMGDADTITEASIDYTVMDPFRLKLEGDRCISDCGQTGT